MDHAPGWYQSLAKPAWQPPDWVFGVMWPANFVALAVALTALAVPAAPARVASVLGVVAVSVGLALGWAYTFYVPHRLLTAAILLACAAVGTWVALALSARML